MNSDLAPAFGGRTTPQDAKHRELFDALARIYAALPETRCDGCARCCYESPGVFFVEHLRLLEYLNHLPEPRREELLRRALAELFFSWIDAELKCIFLESSRCTIYELRPLACRLFGLSSPSDPEQAEAEARLAAREEARRLSLLGVNVPEAVIVRSLASCGKPLDLRGRRPRADADSLAAQVARLDEELLPPEDVMQDLCFLSLPERIGAALLGEGGVEMMRLQLLRRARRGEPLEKLLQELWAALEPGLRLSL